MERDQIVQLLKAQPFEPFTVHTVDGDLIGVKSPEFAWLPPKSNRLMVEIQMGDSGAARIISLDHISQITIGPSAEYKFPAGQQ